MVRFQRNDSVATFQDFIQQVYGLPDDRLYSIWDLLAQQQRFTMRALKGIRKGEPQKLEANLLIALAWLAAIANRLHINLAEALWRRFPRRCSYCGRRPCACGRIHPVKRKELRPGAARRPKTFAAFQAMFRQIYPPERRTLERAGVHLAEEMGEVAEALSNYLGQHQELQFEQIKQEAADFISCLFGVANSAGIDVAGELARMFHLNCHVCHRAPCVCTFTFVTRVKT
ncbi:MAG: hypothetical protein Q8R35_03160 [bacterium]|nr:hypothetical protein [bacterium]